MKEKYIDLIGMYAATLCLIHCLLTPLLFLLPLGLTHNPIIDCTFLCLGIFPVYKVVSSKAHLYLKILLILSISIVGIAIALEAIYHIETFLIYIGAAGLITGHLINYKSHKHA